MKRLINFLDKDILIKIASLNSVAVITRVGVGFLTSKAIAYYIGPAGMAAVGNLRDFVNAVRSFSSLGFYNGIVKYISEFKQDLKEVSKILTTVFISVFSVSLILAIICFLYAGELNDQIVGPEYEFEFVFKLLALALPFYSLNLILLAILNGSSRFKFLLNVSIIGQILGGVVTLFLIWKYTLIGALIAVVISELTILLLIILVSKKDFKKRHLLAFNSFRFRVLKNLSGFSIMALFSAVALPLTFVFIRNYIKDSIGADEAGFWEAINRISKYYLMFISTLLTLYILPRFSEITTSLGFRKEVFDFYRKIVPIFGLTLIIIYFLREFIILIIFTREFAPVEDLFLWQLLGDFIKVLSLVISYQLIAKRMVTKYLITESISIIVLLISSVYLIEMFGVRGATIAHFVTYLIYLIMMLGLFGKDLFGKDRILSK